MYCTEPALPNSWCLFHGIVKSFGLEVTFKGHIAQPSCNEQGELQQIRLLRALLSLTLTVSRDGASILHLSGQPVPLWATSDHLGVPPLHCLQQPHVLPVLGPQSWATTWACPGPSGWYPVLQVCHWTLSLVSFATLLSVQSIPMSMSQMKTSKMTWSHYRPLEGGHQEGLTHLLGLTPRQRGWLSSSINTYML